MPNFSFGFLAYLVSDDTRAAIFCGSGLALYFNCFRHACAAVFCSSGLALYFALDHACAAVFCGSGLALYFALDHARAAVFCGCGSASYCKREAAFSTSAFSLYFCFQFASILYVFHSTSLS